MTQPDLSMPVGPPLAKRCRWVHTTIFLTPSTQEPKATATYPLVQELKGAHWIKGPSLSVPQPKEATIPTKMAPIHINVGDTKQIYHFQVEGCPEGPSTSHVTICAHVHQAHLGMKLWCPSCPSTFFNTESCPQMIWQVGALVWVFRPNLRNVCTHVFTKKNLYLFIKNYIQKLICKKKNAPNVIYPLINHLPF